MFFYKNNTNNYQQIILVVIMSFSIENLILHTIQNLSLSLQRIQSRIDFIKISHHGLIRKGVKDLLTKGILGHKKGTIVKPDEYFIIDEKLKNNINLVDKIQIYNRYRYKLSIFGEQLKHNNSIMARIPNTESDKFVSMNSIGKVELIVSHEEAYRMICAIQTDMILFEDMFINPEVFRCKNSFLNIYQDEPIDLISLDLKYVAKTKFNPIYTVTPQDFNELKEHSKIFAPEQFKIFTSFDSRRKNVLSEEAKQFVSEYWDFEHIVLNMYDYFKSKPNRKRKNPFEIISVVKR